MKNGGTRLAGLAMVGLALAGCQTTTEGHPTTKAKTSGDQLWDPCSQISDDVLRQLQVRPETKEVGVAGNEFPDVKVCTWHNDVSAIAIYSAPQSLAELRASPNYVRFVDIAVAGRPALQFTTDYDHDDVECYVAFDAQQGDVMVNIAKNDAGVPPDSTCSIALRVAEVLVPVLPK